MSNWDHGYVTDIVYTSNFYRECTPSWMAAGSLMLGHRAPDLSKPFRYVDFGCAHGYTAILVAACHPNAEVWGFDFNPAHIESARNLAARAGLTNAHFEEASFADLLARPATALPEFDFAVAHGILSWISPDNQRALTQLLGRSLRPGGMAYLSYNVLTGWSPMVPLRALMHMLSDASPERTDLGVAGVLDMLDRMKAAGAGFFGANPAIENRLKDMRQHDPRYIAHEYLNRDWHPMMHADVADLMREARMSYVGSSTLSENIDAVSVPQGMVQLLADAKDQRLRETLRDFGSGQGFRRDLYRKGVGIIPAPEHQRLLLDQRIGWTGQVAGEQIQISTPMGQLTGRPEIYRPLLAMLEAGPISIGQAFEREPFSGRSLLELLQAATLLIAGGFAHPMAQGGMSAQARASAAGLNRAAAENCRLGGDISRLALPGAGTALGVDLLECLAAGELLAGKPAQLAPLTDAVSAALAASGRSVQREGKVVSDAAEARKILSDALQAFLDKRAPLLRTMGALD